MRKRDGSRICSRAESIGRRFFTRANSRSARALIDLCGIFVVPLAHDFEKVTGDAIAAIFREVTLPDGQFREVAEKLESER